MNSLNNKVLFLILTLVFAVMLCGAASAATAKTSQINPANNNTGGLDVEFVQENPDISGNIVVYEKTKGGFENVISSEIYWKHLVTGRSGRVSSQYGNLQFNPAISGTRVVWEQHISGHSYIYFKNFATGASGRVTSSTTNQTNPDISGTRVVWQQTMRNHEYIYFKNLATGTTGRVTSSINYQSKPSISGTRVVWTEFTSEHSYVYVKNILTGRIARLGTNNAANPDISGDKVVWTELTTGGASNYWRNLVTGAGGKIYRGNLQYRPKISGSRVVFDDYYNGILAIYEKNLVTGSVFRVNWQNGDSQSGYEPAISGVNVVWQDWKVPPLSVYWKNILTGTGGRISTDYPKLIDSGVTYTKHYLVKIDRGGHYSTGTGWVFQGMKYPTKYYWKTYLYKSGTILIYTHFYHTTLRQIIFQTILIGKTWTKYGEYRIHLIVYPKSWGGSGYNALASPYVTTLEYYWKRIDIGYPSFRTIMIREAPEGGA